MQLLVRQVLVVLLLGALCVVRSHAQQPEAKPSADIDAFADTLLATPSPQERQQLLARKKELVTPDLRKALIREGNTHLMAGRYSTAFEIYDLAQNIAQQIGDKEGVASASLDIGTVYFFQANYPAALEHYQKARQLFREVPNDYESAKALSGLALIYKEQRRDVEALNALQQALTEFKSLGDREEMSNTLNSIGTIYYGQGNYSAAADAFLKGTEANNNSDNLIRLADALYMQGDYSVAFSYYKQSLAKLDPRRDQAAVIAALNGAANAAYYQANYEEALRYYQRNLPIQESQRDKLGVAATIKGVGNVYRSRGEYAAALEAYVKSLSLTEELKQSTGSLQGSIGLVRALQGNYPQALDAYQKALSEFEANGNKIDMARALSLIGNVYYAQGSYETALTAYRRGLVLREESDDKAGQGDILSGMGSAFLRLQNYPDALDNFQKALVLFDSVGNRERMADVLTRVSDTFLAQGEYAKALSAAESAITLARQLDNGELLWYAQMLRGKAQRSLDQNLQASSSFSDAIATVESQRNRPTSISSGDHSGSLPYLAGIDLFMSEHRPGEAFDYAERAKVQSLIELLRNSNSVSSKGLTPDEQSEEQRLVGEATSLELQLERESQLRSKSDARRATLSQRLKQTRNSYAEFRQRLFTSQPRLKIDRGEVVPLTLNEMRSLVADSQTALIEYTITERNTYIFVLTADPVSTKRTGTKGSPLSLNLKVYPLDVKNAELVSKIRDFEEQLASRSDTFQPLARELYDLVLRPAADQLILKTKFVIVPDGVLWRLPFEALAVADDHYVLDQAQISYAQSFSVLKEQRKQRTTSPRAKSELAAFGNPKLSKEFDDRLRLAYLGTALNSSVQHEDEIKRIATAYGPTVSHLFSAGEANEERIKAEGSKYNLLHFAAPTVLDEMSPMSSFIGLARGATKQDDGFLSGRELLKFTMTVDLVVMSNAQHTGGFTGTAIPAMSWSWFVGGTPATMLSRWEENDVSLFMSEFYSRIKPVGRVKPSKTRALHDTAMSLRHSSEFQHPYYWANFAMIGDAR